MKTKLYDGPRLITVCRTKTGKDTVDIIQPGEGLRYPVVPEGAEVVYRFRRFFTGKLWHLLDKRTPVHAKSRQQRRAALNHCAPSKKSAMQRARLCAHLKKRGML